MRSVPGIRRYRHRRLFAVAVVAVVGLLVSVEVLLFQAYRTGTRTTRELDDSTNATTMMAGMHREVLEMRLAAQHLDRPRGRERLRLHRDLLEQQLAAVAGHAPTQPVLRRSLGEVRAQLARLDRIARERGLSGTAGDRSVGDRSVGERYDIVAAALGVRVKRVFDDQQHALYETLTRTIERRQRSEGLLVTLGAGVLLLGALLAFVLRRAVRRDFSRAYAALAHEVEERTELHSELERQAGQDALTELANRRRFLEDVGRALRGRRGAAEVGVIYADLDGFKVVNDAFGHAGGDAVLQQVAQRLRGCVRPSDHVARLGGDEFAVLLSDVSSGDAAQDVAEQLIAALGAPMIVEGRQLRVGASVGLAMRHAGSDADGLIREADEAMYTAKNEAKGSCYVLDPEGRASLRLRRGFERELREAVEHRELAVHYQPIVDLADGAAVGHEALVRWPHPTRGLLAPAEFLGTAEHGGLMVGLGAIVLERACVQAAAGAEGSWISVNLAPAQLHDPDLPRHVERALQQAGCDPHRLVLELSERALLRDAHQATRTLEQLSSLGIRVAIDDFGTGHASLSYFRFLPISMLKLDSSFVRDIAEDADSRRLASAIVELAGSLELVTVAEGIERPEQREHLRRMGCTMGQGYLFAPPGPVLSPTAPPLAVGAGTR